MNRRTLLRSAAGALGLGLAGCAATGDDPTRTTVPPVTSDLVESGSGPFEHEIEFRNERDAPVPVTVDVTRGDETLYRRTHSVPPAETGQVVAGLTREELPKRRRTVTVGFTYAGGTRRVTVEVDGCLGDVLGSVDGSGALDVTYSIC